MGDIIALAFVLFIVGTVTGGLKAGRGLAGGFISAICLGAAGLILAAVAFVAFVAAHLIAIIIGVIIIGIVIAIIRAVRRRRNRHHRGPRPNEHGCFDCRNRDYCRYDCGGRRYAPDSYENRW